VGGSITVGAETLRPTGCRTSGEHEVEVRLSSPEHDWHARVASVPQTLRLERDGVVIDLLAARCTTRDASFTRIVGERVNGTSLTSGSIDVDCSLDGGTTARGVVTFHSCNR
jgi:hypothetical protein